MTILTPLPTSSRYLVLKYNRHKIIESLTSLKDDPLMSYVLDSICLLYLLFKDFILRLHKMEVYEAINDLRIQFPFRKRKSFTFQLSFITFKNFFNFNCILKNYIQCPPLYRITSDQHKSDNINWMIQWTNVFCVLF